MAVHAAEYEGRPERRPLTRAELQSFLDAADDHVVRAASSRRKGWLASFRDATVFKVVYGWGLRRRETAMLDVNDFTANPAARELGGLGVCQVRYGKAMRGSPPRRRSVATVMPWTAEALGQYIEEIRPCYETAAGQAALWLTERGGRISPRQIDDRFAQWRAAAGLPAELSVHCLRHSYISHLIEDGADPLFVQQQAGHSWASTTAIYTTVGQDARNRMLRAALARAFEGEDTHGENPRLPVAPAAADGRQGHVRHDAAGAAAGRAGRQAVPRAGIPSGHGRAGTAEPGHPGGTVRHLGLPARRPDRDRGSAGPGQAGPGIAGEAGPAGPGPRRLGQGSGR
jgi:site-specific recombinase XerD